MAEEIRVPELGESITEATIGSWLKQVGDAVQADEPIVELETDKVAQELTAPKAGVLSEIVVEAGQTVEVGALIGKIEADGAAAAKPAQKDSQAAAPKPDTPSAEAASGGGEEIEVRIPEMGESVSEGTLGSWLKAEGDAVAQDETIAEVETDKVAAELPAPVAGTLKKILVQAGETVNVGTVVAVIAKGAAAQPAKPAEPAAAPKPEQPSAPEPAASDDQAMPPAVRRLISNYNLDPASISGSGKDGRLTKADVLKAIEEGTARVQSAPGAAPRQPAPAAPAQAPAAERAEERVPMTRLRKRIAERLKDAQNTAAMLTTYNDVDMTAVIEARKNYRDLFEKKHGIRLGFMSFFVKAACLALREVPTVNARIDGDEIVYHNYADIGVAVSAPQGLVVPILRDADKISFADCELSIADFGRRARDGKLGLNELQGGTFTISNGGIFGSLLSSPIINPPQSAILGMHRIEERPVVRGGQILARPMMYLALSYDHRLIDGREAVTFLVRMKDAIEDPNRLLLDL
ncbi:MAG: 2-oxoglutarate dehydrogenase complex dihydrolipoyllysine-residue succinyltransferase [Rhodothalassiaceae bacterium]